MGTADIASVLFGEVLRHDPENVEWINRDRFVLSAGHGSALLYAVLHLAGYPLPLDELRRLRRLGSLTPGHPEYGLTAGVETTTGPLGAGFATAVGMAIAEARLAAEFNQPEMHIIDHTTWVLSGDGCLMEGVSAEAASLAGHLGLGKLNVIYDSNSVSIEGRTDITFTEDVRKRFEAYGWSYLSGDGHDPVQILSLLEAARAQTDRPTLIELRTRIGEGSPHLADTHGVHGTKLGPEEMKATKRAIGIPHDQEFYIDPAAAAYFANRRNEWRRARERWEELFGRWSDAHPELRSRLDAYLAGATAAINQVSWPEYRPGSGIATRSASGTVIEALAAAVPNFIGGSADLSHSNKTEMPGHGVFQRDTRIAKTIRFGVREHAMASIANGIALHGGLVPFAATLFVFVDYMRPAMRLAALMKLPIPYVLTHDSIYLGGDGPTHQPIEHLNAIRLIPNFAVLRPADGEETVEGWKMALERTDGPTALVLSRQDLPTLEKWDQDWRVHAREWGAYIVRETTGTPDCVVLATGSEVSLACDAADLCPELQLRIVSVVDREHFADSSDARDALLPADVPVVVVEAGSRMGWERFTGGDRRNILGIDRFGESGRPEELAAHFGFSAENVAAMVRSAAGVTVGA
jgi:transketolase